MLINYWVGMIAAILLWGLIFFACFKFLQGRWEKISARTKLLLCLVVSSVPMVPVLEAILFPLIVIEADGSFHKTILIGSAEYDLGNGKKGRVDFEYPHTAIVNQSDFLYVVETVLYVENYFPSENGGDFIQEVPPHSVVNSETKLEFFPDETPPEEMELRRSEQGRKGWLRKADVVY